MKSRTSKRGFFQNLTPRETLRHIAFGIIAALPLVAFATSPAYAVLEPAYQKDEGPAGDCEQSWPVDCSVGGGGGASCGGWRVVKDLAESESMPGTPGNSCSTGVRLALSNGNQTQGQPVGAMFPGKVVFAQSGKARDGKDYGGTVVIQLKLKDGSPQCFLRYMFLDRRDLVKVGDEVNAGQRIGSIASNDMNKNHNWWPLNWPGMAPNVKIDIGCDEALANMGHFMPYERFSGGGPEDPNSCPLTKMRFPSRPLEYLANTDFGNISAGGTRVCRVGQTGKDGRPKFREAKKQDMQENNEKYDGHFVPQVKPRGLIKRKKTPVYALYEDPDARRDLYGANKNRSVNSPVFRDHKNYSRATALGCRDLSEMFRGKATRAGGTDEDPVFTYGDSINPERVRQLLTHCTNQFILGRGMVAQVYEKPSSYIGGRNPAASPTDYLSKRQIDRLSAEDKETYEDALADARDGNRLNYGELYNKAGNVINKVEWMEQCQAMHMEPVQNVEYKMGELLSKAWQEYLIEWPQDNTLRPINRTAAIPNTPLNDYAKYPYERINDPSHPFSPRNVFAETERERYSNYDVQCAATPVDIILGSYPRTADNPAADQQNTYSKRDASFHSCVKCRIDLNENSEACFADPYSFTNLGGCLQNITPILGKELCSTFKLGSYNTNPATGQPASNTDFLNYLYKLEQENGLAQGWLHAIATQESSCTAEIANSIGAKGMFQWLDNVPWNPFDPWVAAEKTAQRFGASAKKFDCKLNHMVTEYNCGGGCVQWVIAGTKTLPTETANYIASVSGMLGGTMNGCSAGGTGSMPGGSGSDYGDVFGGNGNPTGAIGNFDPSKCPANYFSSIHKTSGYGRATHVNGDMACPAFSNPVPDNPHQSPDRAGDSNKWWVNWGCTRNWGINGAPVSGSTMQACQSMAAQGFNGSKWCPLATCNYGGGAVRMHEGIDHTEMNGVPSVGLPVYAAGNGKVDRSSDTSRDLDINHGGYCIVSGTPGNCDEYGAYPAGVYTSYRHMGPRILPEIKNGTEVKRCQQIGTVGSVDAPASGDLHFETHDPNNSITRNNPHTTTYWPYDVNQPFHIHPLDKSCGGGITDPNGTLSARGICKYALPLNIEGKEDLTPPKYYEDYKVLNIDAPDKVQPPSEKRGDRFDIKKKGMVFHGAWRWCDGSDNENHVGPLPPMTAADRAYCESLPDKPAEEDAPKDPMPNSSSAFVNPAPCGPVTSPFGPRSSPCAGCSNFHRGLDIGISYQPILSPGDGVVKTVTTQSCGGVYTEITHPNGLVSAYMHLSNQCNLKPGDTVKQGQVIAISGNTGSCTTGAHLHFIIMQGGTNVDPQPHIPPQNPGAPYCGAIAAAKCGDIITGLETGGGIASAGKKLCVDKPCTVRFEEADTVNQCAWSRNFGGCGSYGDFSQRKGDCCFNITAPVASTNMLKVRPGFDNEARTPGWTSDSPNNVEEFIPGAWEGRRTTNEGGSVDVSATNRGAPEGYTFYEHFRDHRPYIRWWDTGAEVGEILQDQILSESDEGKWDALVGVGIEKENCGYGGWGGNPDQLDGNTSWMELKLYQARTQQQHALRCIGRYERLFKAGGPEDFVHQLAGGKLDTYFSGTRALNTSTINYPLGWRGYVSEPTPGYRFPYYRNIGEDGTGAAHAAVVAGGLDNALPGDILVWDEDVVAGKRLPHVAYVMQANNVAIRSYRGAQVELSTATFSKKADKADAIDSLVIVDYDHGRYPDACGTTNWAGVGPDRVIYKNVLPESLVNEATKRGVNNIQCGNPDLATCIENYWNNVKIYRPWKQVRN